MGDALMQVLDLAQTIQTSDAKSSPVDEPSGQPLVASILLSDGANSTGTADPLEAADRAATLNVPIYTIALGTPNGQVTVQDENGQPTTLEVPPDTETLAKIAEIDERHRVRRADGDDLQAVYDNLQTRVGYTDEDQEVTFLFAGRGARARRRRGRACRRSGSAACPEPSTRVRQTGAGDTRRATRVHRSRTRPSGAAADRARRSRLRIGRRLDAAVGGGRARRRSARGPAAVLGLAVGRRPGAGALPARPPRPWCAAGRSSTSGRGGGIVAIAAALAGAATRRRDRHRGLRRSRRAGSTPRRTASTLDVRELDPAGTDDGWEVVLVGDLWYEPELAARMEPWLRSLAGRGATVLTGDLGRVYLPAAGLDPLATYTVPTTVDLEACRLQGGPRAAPSWGPGRLDRPSGPRVTGWRAA